MENKNNKKRRTEIVKDKIKIRSRVCIVCMVSIKNRT